MSKSNRKPRAPAPALGRESIETAALKLIDDLGLEGFSMRLLGQRLGCEAMSIYHHYPSKAHLLDALVDRVIASAPVPPPGGDAAKRVRGFARGWRAMALAHPRFFPVLSVHRLNSPAGLAYLDQVVAAFAALGLGPARTARLFRAVGYYLTGAALDEISGYARGPSSINAVPAEQTAAHFPHIAQAGRFFAPAQFDRTFDFGLELLLQGIRPGRRAR